MAVSALPFRRPNAEAALVRALARRNATLESVFNPEAGHDIAKPSDSADFMRRVEAFLARHNPA